MMKNLLSLKRLGGAILLFLTLLSSYNVSAQCAFGDTQYPFTEFDAPTTNGQTVTLTAFNFYGEYGIMNLFSSANVYELNIDLGGYVTVFDVTNNPVAFGPVPFSFTPPADGTYHLQWNADAGCGTGFDDIATSVTLIGASSACTNPALAGVTNSSSVGACLNQPITLSLTGSSTGSGLTYQWQSSADGLSYTDIASATNSSLSATQTALTYYQCIVTCAAGTPATSASVSVPMNSFLDCYCESTATTFYDEEILNVTLGTLNNTSDCSTTGIGASVLNQYSDYTNVAAPVLSRTVSYPLSLGIGTCGGNYNNMSKVFIDFNQDGTFDATEEVYAAATFFNGAHIETGAVNIPLTATLGLTKMRVINVETTLAANITACGTYNYGETEDYLVEIGAEPSCVQPTALQWQSGTTTTAVLSWTAGGTETEWEVEYGPVGFAIGSGTIVNVTTTATTTLSALTANTFYTAYVRAICSPTATSNNSIGANFNTYGFGQYIESDNACSNFVDISATGTNLNLTDDSNTGLVLPFPFFYQNAIVNNINVSNNGYVLLNTLTGTFGYDMSNSNNGLYPFIQDLATTFAPAGVFQETIGTAPNRKFIIQWSNIPHYGFPASTDGANFELVIEEATMEFYYLYNDVMMSNPNWDNGADAEIGIRGTQNIDVSINNADYLSDNACAHFFYTDCPKPLSVAFSNIVTDEFSMDWVAGLSGETEWSVEYGVTGFTPGTGSVLTNINISEQQIPNLTPLTTYDVYIYAACANGQTSAPLIASVQTKPLCADPTNLAALTAADSLFASWNWTQGVSAISGFNLQYGNVGFDLYSGTEVVANGANFSDTIVNAAGFVSGVSYDYYVQSVCGTDTSNYVGPYTFTMPLTNDLVCGAENLNVNGTVYYFNNFNATVSNSVVTNQEQSIAPPADGAQTATGWGDNQISSSTWFTFQAPASGQVRISGTNAGFDGQMAVYSVGDCAQFSTFDLLAANDNEIGGTSYAPNFTVCGLTPGSTYYLMHDSYYSWNNGNYSVKITPISLEAGTTTGTLTQICTGDTTNLFTTITGNDNGGAWIPVIPSIALAQDSLFASNGLAYQTFQFEYRMVNGCAYDSIVSSVQVFAPSTAGTDGSLVVCRNQPFNLLEGLGGVADLNGTWYNPTAETVPNGNVIADNFPGQYNFEYVVGNGVCPNDTAIVIVAVQACNYLGLNETSLEGFSLYPNPTEGMVYISYSGSNDVYNYEVLDLNGRKVANKENAINGSSVTEINLNNVENGIYMIRVYNGSAEKTFRVIVK
jgi:hypothetical protein